MTTWFWKIRACFEHPVHRIPGSGPKVVRSGPKIQGSDPRLLDPEPKSRVRTQGCWFRSQNPGSGSKVAGAGSKIQGTDLRWFGFVSSFSVRKATDRPASEELNLEQPLAYPC